MQFLMADLPYLSRYKIMNSTITPRPIAWVTTISDDGILNCGPHSFFNAMGSEPPLVVLGLIKVNGDKDTCANIRATGEFTIGLVGEPDAERMNVTATDAPPEVDELALAGIATRPSARVRPPIIASSPVSFECRCDRLIDYPGQTIVVGEVIVTHIQDAFVLDADRMHLDTPAMKLIARTHGSGWYARTSDQFQMHRPSYASIAGETNRTGADPAGS